MIAVTNKFMASFLAWFARVAVVLTVGLGHAGLSAAQSNTTTSGGYLPSDTVTIRLLDKVVGRSTDVALSNGEAIEFGALRIESVACFYRPPELPPESSAFLKIQRTAVEGVVLDTPEQVFSGWMFASSPGLNALEHPVYDVWVIACKASTPEIGTPTEAN